MEKSPRPRQAVQAQAGGPFDFDEENLLRDLLFLRKYDGFTPARLGRTTELRRALGGAESPFDVLRERFESAIDSLRDPEPQLLRAVFGLSPDTASLGDLDDRRKHYGSLVGRGQETVANLEQPAINHLRAQLVTGWYPLSPLGFRVPESHNGLVQETVAVATTIKDGLWHSTYEQYRILAAFDEVDYLTISSSWPGTPVAFGDFTVHTEKINDSFSHQFWHKTPMRRGEFYDLRFRIDADAEYGAQYRITETGRAFHEPTRRALFRVKFEGVRPERVWRFEGLTFFERPGIPSREQLLTPDQLVVEAKFHNLYGGLHNGIAWQW